ncbi:uncharacterized protein LOC134855202 [Symsagittifera roscoffensis]|uniref:uncharacterized protein LOC134855202 n=1 Tax=Symsagittifera roscoffensis TaxID=84072 RepID=UPI00307B4FFB
MEQLEQQFGIVRDSADFWLESYKNWLNDSGTNLTANGWPETQSEFFSQLVDFINTEYGNAYISNVKFHANNSIKYSRYRYSIQHYEKSSDRIRIMDIARETVDKLSNISQSEAFTVHDIFFIFGEGEKASDN